MTFWTDPAFWAGVGLSVGAYAVGGGMHIAIDYIHGKKLLRQYWDKTDAKIAGLSSSVVEETAARIHVPTVEEMRTGLQLDELVQDQDVQVERFVSEMETRLAKLPSGVPDGMLRKELEEFLHSEPGLAWGRELGGYVVSETERALKERGSQVRGAHARSAQSDMERVLLNAIDFGDQRMNYLWALSPMEQKRHVVNTIARAVRRAGFIMLPINGQQGPETGPALESGEDWTPETPTWR